MSTPQEDEQRRQRKLEEALEVQSLRRIISAYLNYPDAAEEDVRRYERSFNKLQISHKDLLSHYPSKFQKLRRCISANAYFIYSMLQAFEPPLDMSLDAGACEKCKGQCGDNHILGESLACSCEADLKGEMMCYSRTDESVSSNQHCIPCISQCGKLEDEEFKIQSRRECGNGAGPWIMNERQCGNNVSVANNASIPDPPICSSGGVKVSFSSHGWLDPSLQSNVPLVDVDKVRCIIRNIVRDWAAEGQKERDECYKPILAELDNLFPNRQKECPPACLVPGAGLGRLALEISSLGFMCQGNEFSYYMMICSSFILNHTQMAGSWTIYPWIHSNCNSLSDKDQLRAVPIPDIHPASVGITDGFSMCGGDFVEVYSDQSQQGAWDAVVTCFFIDTAHNIIEYIEVISKILKDGGVWINLGPLLYHFADMYGQEDEMSIELSLEDVKMIASHYGFKMEKESTLETTYTTNPRSMMQNRYYSAFWTLTKQRS